MNCLPWVARKRMLGMLNDFSCLALLQFCQLPIRIQNGQIALVNVANRRATAIVSQGHESKPLGLTLRGPWLSSILVVKS